MPVIRELTEFRDLLREIVRDLKKIQVLLRQQLILMEQGKRVGDGCCCETLGDGCQCEREEGGQADGE